MLREARVTFSGIELPHKTLRTFGPTTIVSPHPEDETLACGGLIALLHRNKQPVSIVVVSELCGLRKGEIPNELVSGFPAIVKRVCTALDEFNPSTLVIPFRGDTHADYTATWHVVRTALRRMKRAPRVLEFPVTIGPLTEAIFNEHQPTVWKLDISSVPQRSGYEGFFEFARDDN